MSRSSRALVLAGGGFAASGWEIGLISGIAAAGVDLRDSDLFVGTSSGARVGLYLASGTDLEDLFRRQLGPTPGGSIPPPNVDWQMVQAKWARAKKAGGDSKAILQQIGALALAVAGSNGPERREIVAAQLPVKTWPAKRLLITAVNATTGERHAFDGAAGVDLVDAVAATTASFGYPPVNIAGQTYIDGGFYSTDNADLASGFDQVLILALRPPVPSGALIPLDNAVASLRASGAHVEVIHPDDHCEAALKAGSAANPAVRGPVVKAARTQGERLVEEGRLTPSH